MRAPQAGEDLPTRLRTLRLTLVPGQSVRQIDVAHALQVSNASISAWENPSGALVPEDRLDNLARFFATARSVSNGRGRLIEQLDEAETARYQELLAELSQLRERQASRRPAANGLRTPTATGNLGGRFWHFPGDIPVHIITTRMSRLALTSVGARGEDGQHLDPIPYSDPWNPNYLRGLWDADRDATTELYGHIRAENPHLVVRYMPADETTADDLTAHVVILGNTRGRSGHGLMDFILRRHEWPWQFRIPPTTPGEPASAEYDGEFVVTFDREGGTPVWVPRLEDAYVEQHGPVFTPADGAPGDERGRRLSHGFPQLEYDVAVLARKPNQLNLEATVTVASGVFSRGTLGAVRALTHPTLKENNEAWLYERTNPQDFWMLMHVPVFPSATGVRTVTPDLERPRHLIRLWPDLLSTDQDA